jgi:hypothetical protein
MVQDLSLAIRKHLGPRYDELAPDFSTTGPVERTACEVALLDCFQPYFEYRMVGVCGIPEITLEGTPDDWRRLREKVEALAPYDLDWWLPAVRQVCDQFVRAANGDIDLAHWQDIYKRQDAYGWDNVNGWLVKLVPYLKNGHTGNFTVKNPLLDDPDAEVPTNVLPGGVSQVPFRCRWQGEAEDAAMEFLGAFVGVTQDATTLALRPKLGWAVRQASDLDRLFARLAKHKPAPPLDAPEFDTRIAALKFEWLCELPGDFLSLQALQRRRPLRGRLPVQAAGVGRTRRGKHHAAAGRLPRLPVQLGYRPVGPLLRPGRRELRRPGVAAHLREGLEGDPRRASSWGGQPRRRLVVPGVPRTCPRQRRAAGRA